MALRVVRKLSRISLVLLIATAALWLRSYWRCDHAGLLNGRLSPPILRRLSVYSYLGLLTWQYKWNYDPMDPENPPPLLMVRYELRPPAEPYADLQRDYDRFAWEQYGFVAARTANGFSDDILLLTFPHGVAFLLFGILPGAQAVRWARKRRLRRLNRCTACTYDLTGNSSGVCPECGTAIAKAT